MTLRTEMCEGCEVTSVEEGHDVERVAVRSDVVNASMSVMVKLAKEVDEPDIGQPTAEYLALLVIFQVKAGYMEM